MFGRRIYARDHHPRVIIDVAFSPLPHVPSTFSNRRSVFTTMVAGKSNPQALVRTASTAPKLPPLPKLRVRRPNGAAENPCIGVMSSMLGAYGIAKKGWSCSEAKRISLERMDC